MKMILIFCHAVDEATTATTATTKMKTTTTITTPTTTPSGKGTSFLIKLIMLEMFELWDIKNLCNVQLIIIANLIDPCTSQTCSGEGICILEPSDTTDGYSCRCNPFYTGDNCENGTLNFLYHNDWLKVFVINTCNYIYF